MNAFTYKNGELFAEDVALTAIAADVGTPVYVYSVAVMTDAYRLFVVLPDEIGGGLGLLWGVKRFDSLQVADDVGVVAPVFHCFDSAVFLFSRVFTRSMTSL